MHTRLGSVTAVGGHVFNRLSRSADSATIDCEPLAFPAADSFDVSGSALLPPGREDDVYLRAATCRPWCVLDSIAASSHCKQSVFVIPDLYDTPLDRQAETALHTLTHSALPPATPSRHPPCVQPVNQAELDEDRVRVLHASRDLDKRIRLAIAHTTEQWQA